MSSTAKGTTRARLAVESLRRTLLEIGALEVREGATSRGILRGLRTAMGEVKQRCCDLLSCCRVRIGLPPLESTEGSACDEARSCD